MYAEHMEVGEEGRSAPSTGRLSILQPPGTYTLTLHVDGTELTRPLQVLKDPNSGGTEADIAQQVELLYGVKADMEAGAVLVHRIEAMRVTAKVLRQHRVSVIVQLNGSTRDAACSSPSVTQTSLRQASAPAGYQLPATVVTYWRPLRPLTDDHVLALFFSRQDGAIVYHYDGVTPTSVWYPVHRWQGGEVIRVETPILSVGRLRGAMIAVVLPPADPWSVQGRLQPIESAGEQSLEVYEEGTLLKLFDFP